jgi:hypothetical protein
MLKYSCDIDLNLPRDRVSALFQDPDRIPEWQPSFVRMEQVSGEPGQPGNVHKLTHKMGKREMEMVETITENDMPNRFVATYESGGVWNIVENDFRENPDGSTHWHIETEFRCTGFMRIMTALLPGMFKKQTRKMQTDFKDFAESA